MVAGGWFHGAVANRRNVSSKQSWSEMPRPRLASVLVSLILHFAGFQMAMQDLAWIAHRKKGLGTPCRGSGRLQLAPKQDKHSMLCA
jgi:hypothetical protein